MAIHTLLNCPFVNEFFKIPARKIRKPKNKTVDEVFVGFDLYRFRVVYTSDKYIQKLTLGYDETGSLPYDTNTKHSKMSPYL